MEYSNEARKQLTEFFEGVRLKAYPDKEPKKILWTIGFGHTDGVKEGDMCTMAQAVAWLILDLDEAESIVNNLVKVPLSQCEFDALVDFAFNVPYTMFATSTLLKKLNAGDYLGASKEFNRWIYDDGKIARGLVKRRQAETNWFNHGKV